MKNWGNECGNVNVKSMVGMANHKFSHRKGCSNCLICREFYSLIRGLSWDVISRRDQRFAKSRCTPEKFNLLEQVRFVCIH